MNLTSQMKNFTVGVVNVRGVFTYKVLEQHVNPSFQTFVLPRKIYFTLCITYYKQAWFI